MQQNQVIDVMLHLESRLLSSLSFTPPTLSLGESFLSKQTDPSWNHYASPQAGPDPTKSLKGVLS